MNASSTYSSLEPPRIFPALPLILAVGLASIALLIGLVSQRSLQAADVKGYSASALFNQANAEAGSGKTALAVADYERAKLLAPGDSNIRANLDWVRTQAGLPAISDGWMDRAVSWASPNTMAWLGSLGLVLAGMSWIMARSVPGGRAALRLAALVGMALLVLSCTSAINTWQTGSKAVVITPDAPARISPTTVSEVSFKLRSGDLTKMLGQYGDFVLIGDAAGHSGWMRRSDLTPILPDSSRGAL
jgi:multidrug efflux pump subunit AcrA (membrane-fusion protein)